MVKPEWGTKRTCPKCSTRFYDLGKEDPVHCINCDNEWIPEPVLKSKQPLAFEAAAPVAKEPAQDDELVHCIECGTEWIPESVLTSKQPLLFESPEKTEAASDQDLEAEDLAIDEEEEPSADEEVDLATGDDDLGVETAGEDDEG